MTNNVWLRLKLKDHVPLCFIPVGSIFWNNLLFIYYTYLIKLTGWLIPRLPTTHLILKGWEKSLLQKEQVLTQLSVNMGNKTVIQL